MGEAEDGRIALQILRDLINANADPGGGGFIQPEIGLIDAGFTPTEETDALFARLGYISKEEA